MCGDGLAVPRAALYRDLLQDQILASGKPEKCEKRSTIAAKLITTMGREFCLQELMTCIHTFPIKG